MLKRIITGQYPALVSPPVLNGAPALLIHIAGSGECGPGDGSALDLLTHNGPLQAIAAGSTRFDGLVVAGIQLPGSSYSLTPIVGAIEGIIRETGADPARVFIAGLSLGAGAVMRLLDVPGARRFAAALVIAPAAYPSGTIKVSADRLWIWQNDQDTTVTATWSTGAQTGFVGSPTGTPTWDKGWCTAITGARCLDTHPDKPTCVDHGPSGPKIVGVTADATGYWSGGTWAWWPAVRAPLTVPGSAVDPVTITLRRATGHGGWDEAWANPGVVDWLVGPVAAPVVVPVQPRITYDQIAALAGAAAAVKAAEDASLVAIAGRNVAYTAFIDKDKAASAAIAAYSTAVDGLLAVRATLDGKTL